MIVPLNQVIQGQYTAGSQFVTKLANQNYKGYYCIVGNSRYFSGQTIGTGSVELMQLATSSLAQNNGVVQTSNAQNNTFRYFIKKVNTIPILIREVSQSVFQTFQNNPLYQATSLASLDVYVGSPNLAAANAQMPGLETFLLS